MNDIETSMSTFRLRLRAILAAYTVILVFACGPEVPERRALPEDEAPRLVWQSCS